MVKNLLTVWETWVQSLSAEDPLEEGMATHSSVLAWRMPWPEEPGGLQSVGLQRVVAESGTTERLSTSLGLDFQLGPVPPSALPSHTTSPPVPHGSCKLPNSPSCSSLSSRDPAVAQTSMSLPVTWKQPGGSILR